jgi:hypothetical protein
LVTRIEAPDLVHAEAGAFAGTTRDGHVDPALGVSDGVQGCAGAMAEHCALAKGKYGRHPPPALRRLADRIDTPVNRSEATVRETVTHRCRAHARCAELGG